MAETQAAEEQRSPLPFTLKEGDTFLLANALGDVHGGADGLFTSDTRMVSRFELTVADRIPSLLGSAISQDNTTFTAHLTNRPLPAMGDPGLPSGVIHIERCRVLRDGGWFECVRLTNFGEYAARVPLRFTFDADFADIFEVRGHSRSRRGDILIPEVRDLSVRLSYRGLDGVARATVVAFSQRPDSVTASTAQFVLQLSRGASAELLIAVGPHVEAAPTRWEFDRTLKEAGERMQERLHRGAIVSTSGRLFNLWIEKSNSDLALLTTSLPTGPYPFAGIPWFATPFGRDGLITALQTLWLVPELARGVLRFLASTQAKETSAFRDAEPGKIMHETRRGEMAALEEVPFGRYYGGVDSTPLFVMLAGAYEKQTGDRAVVDEIWPALVQACEWIDQRIKKSPTGFIDYAAAEKSGLVNQGWKDSGDSIFHASGQFPRGPVAVVEVQGYAFAAFNAMAHLAQVRGHSDATLVWRERAERLRAAIEKHYWSPELNFYAIALDGEGQRCDVRASNAGHLLFCGVPSAERAAVVSSQLMKSEFASGWGIRTLASAQARFNPMSYHNGSVWPHDTAICAAGMARYGHRQNVVQIVSEMFEAASHFNMRLPELFCGFPRTPGQGPAPYPVACLPQAWSAGAVFMLLKACLNLEVDGHRREVHVSQPALPIGIETLEVQRLPVGDVDIDLTFERLGGEVVVVPARHTNSAVRVLAHL